MKNKILICFSAAGLIAAAVLAAIFFSGGQNAPRLDQNDPKPAAAIFLLGDFYPVARVIDGDTFEVNAGGAIDTVRVIGIDTPEIADPRKSAECFGAEASSKAKEILSGKNVRLESDPDQGERDKYGRLLRHIFLEDGTNFGLLMIKQGYAREYAYPVPGKYRAEFQAAQNYARENSLGLWGDVCRTEIMPN
ncbi:MAG TPA: thermonuclease family protein [Candidatus Pacearchaeota archaeon]|nr:thermonuclease family protein [Candidatus Pacearchaeota archaeon]